MTDIARLHVITGEAEATYRAMVEVYSALGYELVELPRVPLGERIAFLCDAIAAS